MRDSVGRSRRSRKPPSAYLIALLVLLVIVVVGGFLGFKLKIEELESAGNDAGRDVLLITLGIGTIVLVLVPALAAFWPVVVGIWARRQQRLFHLRYPTALIVMIADVQLSLAGGQNLQAGEPFLLRYGFLVGQESEITVWRGAGSGSALVSIPVTKISGVTRSTQEIGELSYSAVTVESAGSDQELQFSVVPAGGWVPRRAGPAAVDALIDEIERRLSSV